MRKIPTLFKRDPDDMSRVLPEVAVELPDDAVPTFKWDGTCVMWDGTVLWARREVKPGKTPPPNWVEVDRDDVTGKRQGWVAIAEPAGAQWKWHLAALEYRMDCQPEVVPLPEGTYEAVGPHFQGNPHRISVDTLVEHGVAETMPLPDVPTDYEGVKAFMESWAGEGVVWWADGKPVAKLKRRDFGLPWPIEPATAPRPFRVEVYETKRVDAGPDGAITVTRYHWRAVHTSNREIMASGEGYNDARDRDHAIDVLFPGVERIEVDA